MATTPLYIGADHDVTLEGLSAAATATYLNAATVTWNLKDRFNESVTTGTLDYVAASNGNYAGIIQSTITSALTPGALYYLEVTSSEGTYQDFRREQLVAKYREAA